jgi:predicted metal-dependent peptidase
MGSFCLASFQEKLQKNRIGLALSHPFLATPILRLPFKEVRGQSWCPTMATDGYHVFFNPEWAKSLNVEETKGVLAHETLHVVFGHSDRRGHRDPELWNIACDHAINLLLLAQGLKLPAGGCYDRKYSGMAAESIYAAITRNLTQSPARYSHSSGQGNFALPESLNRNQSKPGSMNVSSGETSAQLGKDLIDSNDLRLKPFQDSDAPDREQLRQLRRVFSQEVKSKLHGTAAGFFAEELDLSVNARIPWFHLLRQWLFERVKTDWRSFPFSKKHLWRGFYMPSTGVDIPPEVVFAIDTSGSMSQEAIAAAGAEVRALRETFPCRLTIIQCDAVIQKINRYDAGDPTPIPERIEVKGRGGTDFRPVFEWVEMMQESSLPIVVFVTDGFGTFPQSTITYPTIWIITKSGLPGKQFPFGLTVTMEN